MFRSSPPSGRVRRLLTLITLLCSVVVAAPAAAQEPSEPPTELPSEPVSAAVPPAVNGLDPLIVTTAADDVALVLTDAAGGVASWAALEGGEAGQYVVDLNAPDTGTSPVNGPATVELTAADIPVLTATVLLNRDPVTPTLVAVGARGHTRLDWVPVAGPGQVTYRLERASGAAWDVVLDAAATTWHRDDGLEPGRYRYRLTATVPSADEGVNESAPSVATAVVGAPEPSVQPPPPTAAEPFPPRSPLPALSPPKRSVAVAGEIRGGIEEPSLRSPRDVRRAADGPGVLTPLRLRQQVPPPRFARAPVPPQAWPPAISAPRLRPPPVIPAGGAGMLVVEAASPLDALRLGDLGSLLAVGLLVAMSLFARRRRRQSSDGRSPVST